jgi:Putative bacterial sensory transduction regulator
VNEALSEPAFADLASNIDTWLADYLATNQSVLAVDHGGPDDCGPGERRWYVRLGGEQKEFTTVWLTLGQRSLRYETYVLPWPPQHGPEVFEIVLRRNDHLIGCHYSIGIEDAVFLRGEVASVSVTEAELDRVIGSLFAEVERTFPALVRIAFPS